MRIIGNGKALDRGSQELAVLLERLKVGAKLDIAVEHDVQQSQTGTGVINNLKWIGETLLSGTGDKRSRDSVGVPGLQTRHPRDRRARRCR